MARVAGLLVMFVSAIIAADPGAFCRNCNVRAHAGDSKRASQPPASNGWYAAHDQGLAPPARASTRRWRRLQAGGQGRTHARTPQVRGWLARTMLLASARV